MSQPQSSAADSQALLQSMLQKLKLQPPREGQAHLHLPTAATSAAGSGQNGVKEAAELQGSGSEGNGALQKMQMRKWDSREEFQIPAWGNGFGPATFSFNGREQQENKPGHGFEMDRTSISSSSPKANISREMGEREVLGQATPTGITRSLQDAAVTSTERTKDEIEGEMSGHSNSAMINHNPVGMNAVATAVGQSQDCDQAFKPRVYTWASDPDRAQLHPENGNGEIRGWAENTMKDTLTGAYSEKTASSPMARKNKFRLSESKPRRWTQKIKERWKERPSKKAREEGGMIDTQNQQDVDSLLQNQIPMTGSLVDSPDKEVEGTRLSPDKSDTRLTLSGEQDPEEQRRLNSDFEFGLGSFSLLDEIVTGQEWAKFLNPTQQTSGSQRPLPESADQVLIATNPPHGLGAQSSPASTQHVGENNQWRFSGSESFANAKDFGSQPTPRERSTLVGMDIPEGNHVTENVQNISEPMQHGHSQSDMQPEEFEERQQGRPPVGHSFVKPAEILLNADLKRRVQLNRKRGYASTERNGVSPQTKEETDGGKETDIGTSKDLSVNGEAGTDDMQHNKLVSPQLSFSAPSFTPRGVLKHSTSHDSECSFSETATKKRRVEDTRHVHFSEEVLSIEPELDLFTACEEDSGTEEDSVIEEEVGVEQEAMDIMAPSRRLALPAWILALKRRNTGRKHR